MASAGERCHISVWLSESCCILNLVRQDFIFIAPLRGEGEDATYKELASQVGEAPVAGMVLPGEGRGCGQHGSSQGPWPPPRV